MSAPSPALAAASTVDTLVVKYRDGAISDPVGGLTNAEQAALYSTLQTPFTHVGYTRDGALQLRLVAPLSIDAARAALNRLRLARTILYANLVVPAATQAAAQAASAQAASVPQGPVRRLIVKFRDPSITASAQRNEALAKPQVDRVAALASQPLDTERAMSGGAFVLKMFQALPVDQARAVAAQIETDTNVEYAEPDLKMYPLMVPNDARYGEQWDLLGPPGEPGGINMPSAWDLTTGSLNIVTAVVDTGILSAHPDLAGRLVTGYDFISDSATANDGNARDSDPTDAGDWITGAESASGTFAGCPTGNSSFHGSHVAGTIGAASNNGVGITGINWVSKILPARVLGKCGGFTSDIADAIRWSVGGSVPGVPANANPARVVNMSLGGPGSCGSTFQNAINAALAANAVVVIAAGNSAADASGYSPGNCSGVITVAATGRAGQRASYSNFGTTVEIAAPGGADGAPILSLINTSTTSPSLGSYDYGYKQGTSMATPHVAGIASLMLSVDPTLTPSQVTSKIQSTARPFPTGTGRDCTTALCGAGLIDATAAILSTGGTSRSPTTTTLATSGTPVNEGTSVTLTATVTGTGPVGSVGFTLNGSGSIAGCNSIALTGTGNTRTAACTTSTLPVGTNSIVASYSGDLANAPSSSAPLTQVVNALPISVSFVGTDAVTKGNWRGVYGSDGYAILNDTTSYPAYALVAPSGQSSYVWDAQPSDARALQRSTGSSRIAACWYSSGQVGGSFSVDLNLTDGAVHRVALYLLDWDTTTRVVRVDILNANTQQVLATQTAQSFNGGIYLIWNVQGHVTLRFTSTAGSNAVLSGLFFDAVGSSSTYTVSGSVAAGGNPLSGVTLTPTGNASCLASNTQGQYSCTVPQGYTGSVTPSLSGWSFAPTSRSYSNVTANQTAQDYTATAAPVSTTTVLASSPNPAAIGATVSFTATVNGSNPTGSVAFTESGNALAGCSAVALTGSGNSRSATCNIGSLTQGTHSIVASYGGNAGNASSTSSPLSQVIGTAAAGASASFVGTDATTQGNWKGVYGNDGYGVLNDSTSYPSYAQVAGIGQNSYVWAAQPDSDPRALQRGVTSGRIAACWYNGSSFSVDINLTDGAPHRVSLYLLDWDATGRATRVEVLDASTQQVLSTQNVQSYSNGVYATWNVQGHVVFRLTSTAGPNAVLSGVFFDASGATTSYTLSGTVTSGASALSGVAFNATGSASCSASNPQGQYSCTVPQGYSGTVTPSLAGYSFAPGSRSYNGVAANVAAQDYAATAASTSATFLSSDTTTRGNWRGVYGNDGFAVLSDTTSYPTYAQVTPSGQSSYVWDAQPTDSRALQRSAGSARIAACWYSSGLVGSSFSIDVNLTDGQAHRMALYLLDWDTTTRAVRVDLYDAVTQQLLSTQSAQSFNSGVYLAWNLQGRVTVRVTSTGGSNAVLSGIFFDPKP